MVSSTRSSKSPEEITPAKRFPEHKAGDAKPHFEYTSRVEKYLTTGFPVQSGGQVRNGRKVTLAAASRLAEDLLGQQAYGQRLKPPQDYPWNQADNE